ncbi:MAG: hypothetical protein RLZZ450_4834 [Pseudomonadota bacterium]|jgi:hypothetical protein
MGYAIDRDAPRRGRHTHRGGCDCGAVRYELQIDPCTDDVEQTQSELTVRAREFKLLSGEECVSGHELALPHVHHFYCELCGVCSFTRHNVEQQSAAFYAVELRHLDIPRSVWTQL